MEWTNTTQEASTKYLHVTKVLRIPADSKLKQVLTIGYLPESSPRHDILIGSIAAPMAEPAHKRFFSIGLSAVPAIILGNTSQSRNVERLELNFLRSKQRKCISAAHRVKTPFEGFKLPCYGRIEKKPNIEIGILAPITVGHGLPLASLTERHLHRRAVPIRINHKIQREGLFHISVVVE
ncbi:hypothetical protein TOPH_01077 [Tolypocladium ophioglossoides CBS 100239]|uniref:Uncharacterized protein n=1 Tax=Tolypocladium ophioglossoides (strain CBS 100239) TaxID=1163406 RepID=A0A0L0NJJ2_TOLOC|nr:hypothetical protein TOPH_01077 [Tolypocladium ophioglossoides CBS 100239]